MRNRVEESALSNLSDIPKDDNGPVFREPWEAEAFAMALSAYEHGLFSWSEWAECLSKAITNAQSAGDIDDGSTYYHHWLTALEDILVIKGVVDRNDLSQLYHLWDRAARSTPHGQPIVIDR